MIEIIDIINEAQVSVMVDNRINYLTEMQGEMTNFYRNELAEKLRTFEVFSLCKSLDKNTLECNERKIFI